MLSALVASHFVSLPVISPEARSPFLRLIRVLGRLRFRVMNTLVAWQVQGSVVGLVALQRGPLCAVGLCGCLLIPCAQSVPTSAALQYQMCVLEAQHHLCEMLGPLQFLPGICTITA